MKQNSLFDFPKVKVDKPIRLIELFGGIGSQAMALRDIGADFERYRLVEVDKYAVASYNAIHGTDFETMDIRSIHGSDLGIERRNEFTYLLTYSFPCTDLSIAGRMEGMSKQDWLQGKSTRSGLLWEVERIFTECGDNIPDILLMENVPQVHQDKNAEDFNSWTEFLRKKGYCNFCTDMNAKDYGVAQNRERCFMVKVIDDYLETEVDEQFFITSEKADKLIESLVSRGILPAIEQRAESREQRAENHANVQLICQYESRKNFQGQIVSKRDMTQESQTCNLTEQELFPCLMNYKRIETVGNTVAKTLMARDYKGFGTGFDAQNGVICGTDKKR